MDTKYEGMYRTRRQRKDKVEKHGRRTTCHINSTLPSGNGRLACCTSTRTLLTFFACFHILDGLLIAVGHYSLQRTTTSLKHVEHHIPNYLTATMVSWRVNNSRRPNRMIFAFTQAASSFTCFLRLPIQWLSSW